MRTTIKAMDTFPVRLKQLREENNLSQEAMAARVGISRVSIVNYEGGNRKPDIEVVASLCREFNVTGDYLLGISNYKNIENEKHAMEDYKHLEEQLKRLHPADVGLFLTSLNMIIDCAAADCAEDTVFSYVCEFLGWVYEVVATLNYSVYYGVMDLLNSRENIPDAAARNEQKQVLIDSFHEGKLAAESIPLMGELSKIGSSFYTELVENFHEFCIQTYNGIKSGAIDRNAYFSWHNRSLRGGRYNAKTKDNT